MAKRTKTGMAGADDLDVEVLAVGEDGAVAIPIERVPTTVGDLIAEVASSVVPAARATGPDKFGVEFGIRTRRDGSASLADDPARATFRVFLEWSGSRDS